MAKQRTVKELTELFRQAGCTDIPDSWARSEIDENIPQLSRFLVLKMMFSGVLEKESGQRMAVAWRTADGSGIDHYEKGFAAARRLLESGASPDDLVDLVRSQQIELIFQICYGFSDPELSDEFEEFIWNLSDNEGREINCLHEEVNSYAELYADAQNIAKE